MVSTPSLLTTVLAYVLRGKKAEVTISLSTSDCPCECLEEQGRKKNSFVYENKKFKDELNICKRVIIFVE